MGRRSDERGGVEMEVDVNVDGSEGERRERQSSVCLALPALPCLVRQAFGWVGKNPCEEFSHLPPLPTFPATY